MAGRTRAAAAALCALAAVTAVEPERPAQAQTARPNVVVIVTDDQRGGFRVLPRTRRMLVRQGTVYRNAFATVPLCCPSRVSIMTGLYAHNHGVQSQGGRDLEDMDQRTTIQYALQRAGYRTYALGKLFNGWDLYHQPPYLDRWAIFARSQSAYRGGRWAVNRSVRRVRSYWREFMTRRAEAWIERSALQGVPFYLYAAPPAPHKPARAEKRFRDAPVPPWPGNPAVDEADRSDKPAYVRRVQRDAVEGRRLRRQQYRALMSVDLFVAAVMRALRDTGEIDNTLVILTSDNGYMWGEHGWVGKSVPYEHSVRVPLVARFPGRIPEGSQDLRFVSLVDIAQTVYDATGVQPYQPTDGRSLLDPGWARRHILIEYRAQRRGKVPSYAAIRNARYSYVEYQQTDGSEIYEYYDLESDPWENLNLFGDPSSANDPDRAPLSAQLTAYRNCRAQSCP